MEKKPNSNIKDAVVDIAKSLESVFKKYTKNTREKAWKKITSKDGEKEIKKIIIDPTRPINTFQKLATQKDECFVPKKFSDWVEIREEKDACYHKVKSRYQVWPSAYACVPVKTSKALTREGWKYYNELIIGEEILTYSLQNDCLEFNTIKNLHHYDNAKTYVIKNGNTGWKFECTPNHKWVVKHPKGI